MVSIRVFSMIVATLLCREMTWAGEPSTLLESGMAIAGYWLLFGIAAKCLVLFSVVWRSSSWRVYSGCPLERFSKNRKLLEVLWVMLLPVGLMITSWGPTLKAAEEAGMFQSVSLVLWFLPTLLLLLALEWNHVQLETFIDEMLGPKEYDPSDQATERARPPLGFFARLMLRLKLGELGGCVICIVPVFIVVATTDLAGWYVPGLSSDFKTSIGLLVMLLSTIVSAPWWMSAWMGAKLFQSGTISKRITELCHLSGNGHMVVKCINSNDTWCGAAVVGWHSLHRQLWIGDGLISKLNPMELDMVVLHELAHVVRRHFLWRLAPILLALAFGFVIHEAVLLGIAVLPQESVCKVWLEQYGTSIALMVGLVTTIIGLGWYARRCELDADWHACYLAAKSCSWANGQPSCAATVMIASLENLLGDSHSAAQASWLHPSLDDRLENLYQLIRFDLARKVSQPVPDAGAISLSLASSPS